MSWIWDTPPTYLQKFFINILTSGPVPKHVAFIMDGNRRYASKSNVHKLVGHKTGFDRMSQSLQWATYLGIKEVTVYAFSIENFKRSEEEVQLLMDLAREKFKRLLEDKDDIMRKGMCIRFIGNLTLLPEDIRKDVAKTMIMTKDNNKLYLNIAFAYTSTEEITNSVKTVIKGVKSKVIEIDDINKHLLTECLYTNHCSDPDLIVRTSGEVRFSDFLLWQSSYSYIYFTQVLWPEFSIWYLLEAVFLYQRGYKDLTSACDQIEYASPQAQEFVRKVEEARFSQLESYAN